MKAVTMTERNILKLFLFVALVLWAFVGCSTPFSLTGGFMGANVTANFPNGIQVPAKVVPTQSIQSPALLVPLTSSLANTESTIVTDGKITATVPVVAAPVSIPTLAVPITK
jgi:hypothetical protein